MVRASKAWFPIAVFLDPVVTNLKESTPIPILLLPKNDDGKP